MTVARLTLSQFRNYDSARLDVVAPLVVLTGENGAGKTNALEALSLFAPGRGLRQAGLDAMARQGSSDAGWGVSVVLGNELQLGTGVTAQAPGRRTARVQGEVASIADLARYLALLWLTPAQDRLFLESPSDRRRFLDRLVLAAYPDHAGHVARYEHAQRERLRLLAEGSAEDAWLAALEGRIAEHGVAASAARLDITEALAPLAAEALAAAFPPALLALEGDVEALLQAGHPALAAEDRLKVQLKQARTEDARTGRSSIGPGRCDLKVVHAPKGQAAALCSTGEQKALLIGLMLAQARLLTARRGAPPLLLLDEVAAHLDERRRSALFDVLEALRIPCWMTGTDAPLFASLQSRAAFALVRDGQFHI